MFYSSISRPSWTVSQWRLAILSAMVVLLAAGTLMAKKKPPQHPLDLNTATVGQLEALPGIGPVKANAIIEFRKRSGPFRSVNDLLAVRGISRNRLQKIRPYVTIGPGPAIPREGKRPAGAGKPRSP